MFLAARQDGELRTDPRELDGDGLAEACAATGHDHRLSIEGAGGDRIGSQGGGIGQAHAFLLDGPARAAWMG